MTEKEFSKFSERSRKMMDRIEKTKSYKNPILKTTKSYILATADEIVNGARNESYGNPEDNFSRIANFWSTYLKTDITAHDVAIMMMLLKIARTSTGTGSMDNYVDIAGYAACAGEIYNKGEE